MQIESTSCIVRAHVDPCDLFSLYARAALYWKSKAPRLIAVHAATPPFVRFIVTSRLALALLAAAPVWSATSDISRLLKGVEDRYNHARTLEVDFRETYVMQGRRRTESGELFLRKPGRMRWQYSEPAGKLFVSDGKYVYFFSPDTNRAEKMSLKATDDMRAPMAFLLGKLDFSREFKEFQAVAEGGLVSITALPKSDRLPYREVKFAIDPNDYRIARLLVSNQDASVLDFTFSNEKLNPQVNDAMFRFQVPPGAEFVDSTRSQGGE
jgi:outer membrane lipoprotein carrier protein